MGGIYAREEGQPEAVWQAIYDQYLPAATDDPLPRGRIGRIVALADRLDTLVGFFGLGLIPTGSKDPFGLRRAALGVVRLLLEGGLALGPRAGDSDARGRRTTDFRLKRKTRPGRSFGLSTRTECATCSSSRGLAHDEIEAALGATGNPLENLPSLERRVRALHDVRDQPHFLSMVLSDKRIANILRDVDASSLPAQPDGRSPRVSGGAGAPGRARRSSTPSSRRLTRAGDFAARAGCDRALRGTTGEVLRRRAGHGPGPGGAAAAARPARGDPAVDLRRRRPVGDGRGQGRAARPGHDRLAPHRAFRIPLGSGPRIGRGERDGRALGLRIRRAGRGGGRGRWNLGRRARRCSAARARTWPR